MYTVLYIRTCILTCTPRVVVDLRHGEVHVHMYKGLDNDLLCIANDQIIRSARASETLSNKTRRPQNHASIETKSKLYTNIPTSPPHAFSHYHCYYYSPHHHRHHRPPTPQARPAFSSPIYSTPYSSDHTPSSSSLPAVTSLQRVVP